MRGRRLGAGLAGSPVLVGAVTSLVTIVAVFLAYNANSGLPFVPTYDVRAQLPNAANLVVGNDVRIAGQRVGVVEEITPVNRRDTGETYALVDMKLQTAVRPLPIDSTLVVRPRSALGLKYVEITPGRAAAGFPAGSTIPRARARPEPVEFDDVLNTFDAGVRRGAQRSLDGIGGGLAGRGEDLGRAIDELQPLLTHLEPVARDLADPETELARLFAELGDAAAEVAPVAGTQAALFVNLDTTFTALATVARPFIQDTISRAVPAEDTAIAELPRQRPFLRNATGLARELAPGVRVLPRTVPDLADALEIGTPVLRRTPALNERLEGVFLSLAAFSADPLVPRGVDRLRALAQSVKPTLSFLTPAQTVCNYATLWFRNISSLLSEGDSNGTWQRFIIIATPQGPNNEGGPSSRPADGPATENHLHSNPYPSTAAPGQPQECEGGNEPYRAGRTTIGNVAGNQGTTTSGQGAQR
jgi:virulence factor Mce-like protein